MGQHAVFLCQNLCLSSLTTIKPLHIRASVLESICTFGLDSLEMVQLSVFLSANYTSVIERETQPLKSHGAAEIEAK